MTSSPRAAFAADPDALADLERERDILLRELDELDEQLKAGEISQEQHARLGEALTSHAAATIVAMERGRPSRGRQGQTRSLPVSLAVVTGVLAMAVVTGWLLIDQLAPRVAPAPAAPAASSPEQRSDRLAEVVTDDPSNVPARLGYARFLIEQEDLPGALEQYDAVVALEPSNAEALAYGGWVAVLTDSPKGLDRLQRATAADPGYPDAHALLGLALMRGGDPTGARSELTRYLEIAPQGPLAPQVQQLIDRLGAAP